MRHALLAAALAFVTLQPALAKPAAPKPDAAPPAADAAPADPAPDADPALTDLRCMVVAGVLLGADDEQMRSLGRASLFYYLGRLQGRGDTDNLDARIVEVAGKMSEADVNAQSRSCGARFTAATQALQSLNDALAQHFGGAGGGAAAPK
jgi:hypothetical protein